MLLLATASYNSQCFGVFFPVAVVYLFFLAKNWLDKYLNRCFSCCFSPFHVLFCVFSGRFQSICGSGKQRREPGGTNQTGSRAAQDVHEGDGTISAEDKRHLCV